MSTDKIAVFLVVKTDKDNLIKTKGIKKMKAEEIMRLKVVDVASGTNIGSVTGVLIDGDIKKVIALEVGGGLLSRPDYLPFESISSIDNDILMISSAELFTERGEFKSSRLFSHLNERDVITEDGKKMGTIHEYDVDIKNGMVTSITVAIDKNLFCGLWRSTGELFDISRSNIVTIGDNVVVNSSVTNIKVLI